MAAALILVVDDYDDALLIFRNYLTFKGYEVITAKNGVEAIAMAHAHRPQLSDGHRDAEDEWDRSDAHLPS